MNNKEKKDYIHKEFPKECDPKDFFGQVKRTVNGQPVSEEQITMITDSIASGLLLNNDDYILDIGCGNAALAARFFDSIKGYTGIDFSEYLIQIGKENFERPGYDLILSDALQYLQNADTNNQITKVLCYGVFSYFTSQEANEILNLIIQKYPNATRFYIGNIPDKERADKFYYKDIDYSTLLDDNQSSIGKWWTKNELETAAKNASWHIEFKNMPEGFYSAHYRFDAILKR